MTSIFINKTGKEESEIRELLKEDKFLDANEALDWGFVDNVTQPVKIAAKLDRQKIKNSNLTENQKQQLLKSKKMDLSPITNQLKDLTEKVGAFINANKEVKIADETEISATLAELNENLNVLGEENVEKTNTIKEIVAENKTLKEEIAKYKATQVEVTAKVDEEPTEVEVSNEGAFGNLIKSKISNRLIR
jgi:enoyl-CoA hydratase/carnithine racemase